MEKGNGEKKKSLSMREVKGSNGIFQDGSNFPVRFSLNGQGREIYFDHFGEDP